MKIVKRSQKLQKKMDFRIFSFCRINSTVIQLKLNPYWEVLMRPSTVSLSSCENASYTKWVLTSSPNGFLLRFLTHYAENIKTWRISGDPSSLNFLVEIGEHQFNICGNWWNRKTPARKLPASEEIGRHWRTIVAFEKHSTLVNTDEIGLTQRKLFGINLHKFPWNSTEPS